MRLKELRKKAGLTQRQFAKAIGAAQNTVSQWETGIHEIDNSKLKEIATFFGVSTDYLLGHSDVQTKNPADNVSEAKREMIELIDQLSDDQVRKLLQIANAALEL